MYLSGSPKIYYEKSGSGKPLILLHGNKESCNIFDELANELNKSFTVYKMDSRGHGKSEGVKEYHYSDMARDVLRLVDEENLQKPCIYGFSDGGIIALICAFTAPDCFEGVIASGANITVGGLKDFSLLGMRLSYFFTRDARTKMMLKEPNISLDELKKIKCPVLITAGENDLVKTKQTKLIAQSIKNSRLIIFKGKTHGDYIVHNTFLAQTIKNFLPD